MIIYGLIGFPLEHSWSPAWFSRKFEKESIKEVDYQLFPIKSIDLLPGLVLNTPSLAGLNVTKPYKVSVIPFLDSMDTMAKTTGAVNVIRILRNQDGIHLQGYNTDVPAFNETLVPLLTRDIKSALILGSGGASKAVALALKDLNIPFLVVSRTQTGDGFISYDHVHSDLIRNTELIINATPLGQEGNPGNPLPGHLIHSLHSDHLLYDLVYNPPLTEFLRSGEIKGCRTKNGYEMLVRQAERSWMIWTSVSGDDSQKNSVSLSS